MQTEIAEMSQLESITRAEIDIQIATAKRYPREVAKAQKAALAAATLSEWVADECIYHLRRSGKEIEGPSVRLAEILVSVWGNLHIACRVREEGEREVTAAAIAKDLEVNNSIGVEVSRRITSSDGKRYNDDMINVTKQAAIGIAFRNAVLKIIPKAFWGPVYQACNECVRNGKQSIGQRRAKAFQYFEARKIPIDAVLRWLGKPKPAEVDGNDLADLRGLINAVNDGEATLEEEFGIAVQKPMAAGMPEPVMPGQALTPGPAHAEAAPVAISPPAADPVPAEKRGPGRPRKADSPPQAAPPAAIAPTPAPPPAQQPPPAADISSKIQMWQIWAELRRFHAFTEPELAQIRQAAGVQIINYTLSEEQIAALVAAGKELRGIQ